jgi:formate-dependent nitrite reductase cytochrome c552 subunit
MRLGKTRELAGLAAATLMIIASTALAADQAPPAKAKDVKSCAVCHKPEEGQMRAFFDEVSMKSQVIQLKLESTAELVKFDEDQLTIVNGSTPDDVEKSLRDIKKGSEVRVAYVEAANGSKSISEISIKPKMTVAAEKRMSVESVEKLIAGKEKYTLIDARPPVKFQDGSIPTAINIPFPAFQKNLDKLPQDKNELIVYYCAGVT